MVVDESFKAKVEVAIKKAFPNDPDVDISLEDVPPDRLAGRVLSGSLKSMSPSERQDLIWKELDAALSPAERTRISFIVTDTPEEYRILSGSAE